MGVGVVASPPLSESASRERRIRLKSEGRPLVASGRGSRLAQNEAKIHLGMSSRGASVHPLG